MSKNDSMLPELHGVLSVFVLSFHNIVNLITVVDLIILNKSFLIQTLPNPFTLFFKNYTWWILLVCISLLILNNILLYKPAKNLGTKYDKLTSSIYVFSYFIVTILSWIFVATYGLW